MPETLPALAGLSDEVRADLLRAQREGVTTPQQLPRIKVMPAGAGLYEFDDTHDTTRSFQGVILHHHPRNVLWDKKFGVEAATPELALPACSSNDGRFGMPREGFAHAGLAEGEVGDGVKTVECRTCPYNQWGSGAMLISDKNPRGKAVTNQRSVYVVVPGRELPYELVLAPTSLAGLDEYIISLTNRGIPVQAVMTEFRQEIISRGAPYAIAIFSQAGMLDNDAFVAIMGKRSEYMAAISPQTQPSAFEQRVANASTAVEDAETEVETEEELPF